ncbi:MMPL family transporter [Nocardioides nitrophenolicus]|uniref:MMPL family transporter n=1 Tax=Nocardioides nitrophenolicus TaxID=60489 RepID=UPI00195A9155|nr:MMPL family transporter [Nocardioides nitrophenolicus]MBM7517142.1 RND superfamily putative drug exporter [Nocardioides nitrophenolicus]
MGSTHGDRAAGYARIAVRRAGWVVLAWLAITVVMNVAVPQLEEIAGRDSSPMVPKDAPSMRAVELMNQEFSDGDAESFIVVAMERTSGLTRADRTYAESLVGSLGADQDDVAFVQDIRDPALRKALTSEDRQARYLLVGITGATGAPASLRQVAAVREIARAHAPEGLTVQVTGPTATVVDLATETEHSVVRITVVTIGLIALILFLIYRSIAIPVLILTVVGLGLGLGRAVVAWCGLQDLFAVSTFSGSFLTAIVLGAGTDYAVFLVARYHEQRRLGVEPARAAAVAATRVGSVIAGSAVTVVLATLAMALADLGFFNTTGPAVAVSIAVNLLVSLTLTPALLALAGRRGWAEPRDSKASGVWERVAGVVAAHPARMLTASLVPLALLAAVFPLTDLSYDVRDPLPDDAESNQGYALLGRHFPVNEVLPDYILVRADHDLRTSKDLAVLERASAAVAQHDGVALVRGVTRPLGVPITEASVAYQSGLVGDQLDRAQGKVAEGTSGAERLADGAGQLDEGAGQLAAGADQAVAGADRIAASTGRLTSGMTKLLDGADAAIAGTGDLRTGAGGLADGLDTAADQVQVAVDGLALVHDALATKSLTCGLDPACRQARTGLKQIWEAERDQLLPGLREAAKGARALATGSGDLQTGLQQLRAGLAQARDGSRRLADGQRVFADRLGDLSSGADELAAGAGRLRGGTEQVAGSLPELEDGLAAAARHLRETRTTADDPVSGGFYLPPTALRDQDFAAAMRLYLSPDGRTARLAVLGSTDAFGPEASARVEDLRVTVETSLNGTRLDGAEVLTTGMASTNADLRGYSMSDLEVIAGFALVAVFLVLLLLLRSLVAALALMATVVLSYVAAIGLSVLVWQYGLGIQLDWTVAAVAFVVLVAVGADYNLLLTKRMHEEAPDGSAAGIARATAATGGVITSAGVIFAVSMMALLAGRVTTIGQVGFTIAVGLLLDTFVVRSLLVPALATVLGRRLWWPQRARVTRVTR